MPNVPIKIVGVIELVVLVVALGAAGFFYYRYQQEMKAKPANEIRALVHTLSRIIELPAEEPTLATVTDPSKLADQPFFKTAQAGDKVLIFTTARKAILYRPGTDKIIDVAPIQTVTAPATATPPPPTSPSPSAGAV